jgi:DNA gyrase/topoisomerase IV subunit B
MKLQPETIVEETQREAIVNRPHNLAGSVQRVKKERFKITPTSVELQEANIVPAVLKLFQEALDNPIDVAIKSGFACANKINIKVTTDTISVQDNGYGISSAQDTNGEYILYKAMCKYNTSSNYTDANEGQKGVNGIGIKLCTTLSTYFEAISDDGIKKIKVIAKNNNFEHEVFEYKTKETGTEISFKPDFKIFEIDSIDQEHIDRMYEYVLIQALTYPHITFKFNGQSVKYTAKKFLELFNSEYILQETDDYFFAIMPNESDDFKHISFVNGLETARGGSHINYVMDNIVSRVRDVLVKKFKTLKPADVKNRLQLVLIAKNLKGAKWDGQTKESITNPPKDMSEYFKEIDFDTLAKKLLKNSAIIDPITEVYKLKEELKKRQEMKGLEKTKKKIKSEKYLPSIGVKKYLMIGEGASAISGLIPVLGRKEVGYYELKGVPLNAITASHDDFMKNKELTELFSIIRDEGYELIITATDQDLDGIHIRGLLIGFFDKMLPEFKGKIGMLNTPVIGVKKGNKIVRWSYNTSEDFKVKSGEESHYYKGLGSWVEKDLKDVVQQDGLDKMIQMIDFDSDEIIQDWLAGDNSDKRKDFIGANIFNIAKL